MSKINTVRFCLPEFARNRFKKKKKLSRKKNLILTENGLGISL